LNARAYITLMIM